MANSTESHNNVKDESKESKDVNCSFQGCIIGVQSKRNYLCLDSPDECGLRDMSDGLMFKF